MPIVADAAVAVRGDFGPFQKDLKNADGTVKSFGARLKAAMSPGNIAGGLAAGFGVAKVIDFLGDAGQAAGVFQDTVAATGIIFTDQYTPALEAWAETAHSAFGASKQDALDAANQMAVFGKSAGLVGDDLVGFSQELTQLGGDLASMFGGRTEDAITAVGAALRGESEPIRRYGVLLDDATLRQRAFEMGLISTTKNALTPQQRVLAAHAEIMAQTTDAQGDFARTSGGLMNQQRIAAAKLDNAMIELGQSLVPLMTAFAGFAAEALPAVIKEIKSLIDVLIPMGGLLAEHADVILPALVILLGVKLAGSLKTVTTAAKTTKLSISNMLGPLGLFILAAEGLAALTDPLDDWTRSLIHGAEAMEELSSLTEIVGDEMKANVIGQQLKKWGISVEDFGRLVEAAEGDVDKAFQAIADASGDASDALLALSGGATTMSTEWAQAWESAADTVRTEGGYIVGGTEEMAEGVETATEGMAPAMARAVEALLLQAKEVPEGVAVTLDNGQTVVGTSAEDLAQLLPAAIRQARRDAVIEALPAPAEIADALLAGKEEFAPVRQMIIDALKDPVSDAQSQAEAQAVLFDPKLGRALGKTGFSETQAAGIEAAGLLVDSILAAQPNIFDAGTKLPPAIARGFKSTRGDVIQAVRDLNDDQAMTAGEVAAYLEDAGEEGLAALVRGIRSKKSDVETAQLDMNDAVVRKANLLADPMFTSGFTAGNEFSSAIDAPANKTNATTAANALANAAKSGLTADASGAGASLAESYIAGLTGGIYSSRDEVQNALYWLKVNTIGASLPRSGPMQHPETGAISIAEAWGDALVSGIRNIASEIAPALGSLLNPNSGIPSLAGGGASPVGLGSGAGNTYNVTTASRPKEKTTLEIAHELRRAEFLHVLPGLNTNDQ